MNPQFKKGVLELIVLESVRKKDMYGYELVEEVSKVIDVNEGTIYPLLKRLTNEHYFETYLRESTEGPPRKYYHLTAACLLYTSPPPSMMRFMAISQWITRNWMTWC